MIAIEELKKQNVENLSTNEVTLKKNFSEYKEKLELELIAKNGQLIE